MSRMSSTETADRRLVWHGMFLFLLELATGFAAHLEGVMNGLFLLAIGGVWTEVRLPVRTKAIAYCTALYGTYANWFVTTLAAVFEASSLNPITGAGDRAPP